VICAIIAKLIFFGVIAQLVERFNGIEEVSGSIPLNSIRVATEKNIPIMNINVRLSRAKPLLACHMTKTLDDLFFSHI
jgi:hypothetical protein